MSSCECVLCFLLFTRFLFPFLAFLIFTERKFSCAVYSSYLLRYPPSTLIYIYTSSPLKRNDPSARSFSLLYKHTHISPRFDPISSLISSSFSDFISNFDLESSSSLLTFTATLLTFILICSSFARCYIEYM